MDNSDQIPELESTVPVAYEKRGVGGKLRRPPSRKPTASPYARPPVNDRRRWISKLVDPAYRIIAGGATRFLPSFLSSPASASALLSPPSDTEDQDDMPPLEDDVPMPTPPEHEVELEDVAAPPRTDELCKKDDPLRNDVPLLASELSEMESTGDINRKLNNSFDFVLPRQDEKEEQPEKNMLSDIERLVKGKKFTRDEFNHLVEVLNSREINVSNAEQEQEHTNSTSRQDDEGIALARRLSKVSNEQRHQESKGAIWGSTTPLCLSNARDEIGASPMEIARAYMNSRASEVGPSSKSITQTIESAVLHSDEAVLKPYDPSPSKKSSTGWPGAVVQNTYGTPQSQRSRYGLHDHPRTPYSRTLLTKSRSKWINHSQISSTPLRQSPTTLYLQDKSDVGASESRYGSVGPIRRSRHKVGVQSTPQRSPYSSMSSSQRESSSFIEGLNPIVTTSLDLGRTIGTRKPLGFEQGVPTVHMHTSLMAKKILDHIDRNIPTPKEKSAELKFAAKWKNPESSVSMNTILSNEVNGLSKVKDVSPCKYDRLDGKKSRNEDKGNCDVDIQSRESTDKSVDLKRDGTSSSDMIASSSMPILFNGATTTQKFGGSQMFSVKSTEVAISQENKSVVNNAASKPVLPPISVKKPESRWNSASDNSLGFTFPVSTSSSVFSEPPTPSILPLFSTSNQQQQLNEKSTEPSYHFGIKKSNLAVVFSFPSTSNTTVHSGTGAIKFNFGSTDESRLSFAFEKNAACC